MRPGRCSDALFTPSTTDETGNAVKERRKNGSSGSEGTSAGRTERERHVLVQNQKKKVKFKQSTVSETESLYDSHSDMSG